MSGIASRQRVGRRVPGALAMALRMREDAGMWIDFTDMSMYVKDNVTAANNFLGNASDKLTYTSPSAKYVLNSQGLLVGGSTLKTEFNSSGAARGLLVEEARTNICLRSDDLTNASWTKSSMTTSLTATGPDGNSATICTATAGNATALQAITSGSAARVTSVWLRRRTGTGNIDLTQDNGSTWTTQTLTSSWQRFELASVTSTNPTVGIRIVTSGDAVDVFGFQHETGSFVTSTIPTAGSTVTRARDDISIPIASMPFTTSAATLLFEVDSFRASSALTRYFGSLGTATSGSVLVLWNGTNIRTSVFGGINLDSSMSARTKPFCFACALESGSSAAAVDGTITATSASAVTLVNNTTFFLMRPANNIDQLSQHVRSLVYLPRRVSNADLQQMTRPPT